jgi:N-acetyl sugar amidotransferase
MSQKNQSLFGLPENVKFCKMCVISNQKPYSIVEFKSKNSTDKGGILIDEDNICSACRFKTVKAKIDWNEREEKLIKLLDRHRKGSGYDCIVPSSGGKDSSFAAHVLKYKYNMNPLTVTWAPHLYTNPGWKNFESLAHVGGIDNILYTPNGKLHRKLTQLAFLNLLHPFQPFIVGQKIIGPNIAAKFDVPLIFYGENQAEYGNPVEQNKTPNMDKSFFSSSEIDIEEMSLGGVKIKNILKNEKFKINDFTPYIPVSEKIIREKKIEIQYLGYYINWDQQECYYYAAENTGFKPNDERNAGTYSKYCSFDDKVDDFHWFTTFIKFGIARATWDACQEIRTNKITRKEGVSLVKKYDGEFPKKYFKDFLDYIDIDEKLFWKKIDSFRSPHLWEKKDNKWILKKQVN